MTIVQNFVENKADLTRYIIKPILTATGVAVLTSTLTGCDVTKAEDPNALKSPVDKVYDPSYVDQHKKRFKSHYVTPTKRVQGFDGIRSVEDMYHKGMLQLDAGDNVFVQNLQTLGPAEAASEAKEFLKKQSRFRPDRMQGMSSNEQATLAASVILSLRQNGITEDERDYQESFLHKYQADPAYVTQEKEMATSLAAELAKDPELQANLKQWIDRGRIKTQEQAEQQYALRAVAMQYIADKMHQLYGAPEIPVEIVRMGNPDLYGVRLGSGAHTEGRERIRMNNIREFWGFVDNMNDFEDAVSTLVHEVKHSVDAYMVKELLRGNLSEQSPEYGHAVISYVNSGAGYIDNNLPWHQSAYEQQYLERNADQFAEMFLESYQTAKGSKQTLQVAKID